MRNVNYSASFANRMRWLSILVAVVIGLATPITYYMMAINDERDSAARYAKDIAQKMQEFIAENPRFWQYNAFKLLETVKDYPLEEEFRSLRITNAQHKVVNEIIFKSNETILPPIQVVTEIRFAGSVAGYVYVVEDVDHVAKIAGLLFLAFSFLGSLVSLLIYHYSVKIVRESNQKAELYHDHLEELNEKYSKAFSVSPDSMVIARLSDGHHLEANQGFTNLFGYTREEVIGKTALDLGLWAKSEDHNPFIKTISEEGMIRNYESQVRIKNGDLRTILLSAALLEIGGETCLLVVARDITEQKLTQTKMHQMERMSSLGSLAAGVVHEISQPLQALKLTIDGLIYWHDRGKEPEPAKIMDACRRAADQSERIAAIIRRLRSFISQSKAEQVEVVNLNDSVKQTLDLLHQRLKAHNITLRQELSSEPPVVWGSSGRIEEVVINLTVNAIQALDSMDRKDKEILIRTSCDEGIVRLEVYDNGPDIPAEIKDKIFDPLFSTKANSENMGLGLSIVKSVVDAHDGHIEVVNHDEGVSFRIEFPMYKKESSRGLREG